MSLFQTLVTRWRASDPFRIKALFADIKHLKEQAKHKRIIEELKVICDYHDLVFSRTAVWEGLCATVIPSEKVGAKLWLTAIVNCEDTTRRRYELFDFMLEYNDITIEAENNLRFSENGAEFKDWLDGR